MKRTLCAALCMLVACGTSSRLHEGRWTGTLTPMNHPEMANPVAYDIRYTSNALKVDLVVPGGAAVPTRDVRLAADTLRFTFDEPEEGVPLRCALGRDEVGGFAGRCVDASGKWAWFTMYPPE